MEEKSPSKETAPAVEEKVVTNPSEEELGNEKTEKKNYSTLIIVALAILCVFSVAAALRLYVHSNDLDSEVETLTVEVNKLNAQVNKQVNVDVDEMEEESSHTDDTDSDEDSDSVEDTSQVMYKYTYNGEDYTFTMDNPEELGYEVVEKPSYGPTLVVELDAQSTLEVYLNPDGGGSGIYGEYQVSVNDQIVRNRYMGADFYLLQLDDEECDGSASEGYPCIMSGFHNGPEGILSGYVLYGETDPTEASLAVADAMIKSYEIE